MLRVEIMKQKYSKKIKIKKDYCMILTHLLVPFICDPLDLNLFPTHDALQLCRQMLSQTSGKVPLKMRMEVQPKNPQTQSRIRGHTCTHISLCRCADETMQLTLFTEEQVLQ